MITTPKSLDIRSFQKTDEPAVVALWQACGLTRPWNDPSRDIARKQAHQPELFLVGLIGPELIASVMGGYDGHRGWASYLAVSQSAQGLGYGRKMVQTLEHALTQLGCPKLNLQIRAENDGVVRFYESLGYTTDPVVSMGKRLIPD